MTILCPPPLLFPQPRKEYGTWMGINVLNFPPRISPFPLRNIVANSLQDFSARIATKNSTDSNKSNRSTEHF